MRGVSYTSFVALSVLVACRPVMAQEPVEAPPKLEGNAELSFVGTTGNTSTSSLGVGGAITYRPQEWELSAKTTYVRTEDASSVTAEVLDAIVRAARGLGPRVSAYSRYAYLRNRFAGIENRHGIDAGIAVTLLPPGRHELMVNGGVGYSSERRVDPPDVSWAGIPLGAFYAMKFSETASISNDFAFVLSLEDAGERRLTDVAALTAQLTSLFSLKVSYTLRHLSRPAPGFERLDTITAIALVATF